MHVVGVSYGAYTALEVRFASRKCVRTLTLVEPPLIRWLPELPGGAALFDEFYGGMWQATGKAFERGDPMGAPRDLARFLRGSGGMDKDPLRSSARP